MSHINVLVALLQLIAPDIVLTAGHVSGRFPASKERLCAFLTMFHHHSVNWGNYLTMEPSMLVDTTSEQTTHKGLPSNPRVCIRTLMEKFAVESQETVGFMEFIGTLCY